MRTTFEAFDTQDGHNRGLGPQSSGQLQSFSLIADTIATIHTERRADTPGHTLPAGLCGRPVAADRIKAIAARRRIGHHRTAAARWNTLTLRRRILHPTPSERHADPTAVLDDRNQASAHSVEAHYTRVPARLDSHDRHITIQSSQAGHEDAAQGSHR